MHRDVVVVRRGLALAVAAAASALVVACGGDDPAAAPPAVATVTAPPTTAEPTTTAPTTTHAAPVSTTSSPSSTTTAAPAATKPVKKAAVKPGRTTDGAAGPPPAPAYQVIEWPPFTPAGPLDGVAALTGEPAGPDVTGRAALAVKVDNTRPARPQWALDAADVVFEENVEGITRFIAVFHSRLPASVGPVRSARTSDLRILAGMNRPILAWSGGNANVTAEVRAAADAGVVVDLSALRVGCYRRDGGRRAPHNLVLDPACAHGRAAGAPARPMWTFDPAWLPGAAAYGPDSTFEVPMDGVRVSWTWDPARQRYLRSQDGAPHRAANGEQIAVTNVVTLYVPHVPSPADGRSPEAVTIGTGPMTVHRDGVATVGTWQRDGPYEPFTFRDRDGRVVPLRPGTTFVQLARGA